MPTDDDVTGTPATGTMTAGPTSMDVMASPSPLAGKMSVTTVEASLSDLAGGGHVIDVHESAENIGNYFACGDITGSVTGEELTTQLEPRNDSGYSDTALPHDNGDGTTMMTITLMHNPMQVVDPPIRRHRMPAPTAQAARLGRFSLDRFA